MSRTALAITTVLTVCLAGMLAPAAGQSTAGSTRTHRLPHQKKTSEPDPEAAPGDDACAGAIVIPATTFPYVTAAVDVSDATPQGSDDPDVCPVVGVDRTIWFAFTPTVAAQYTFSTCAGDGASGSTVYDSVIGVLDACPPAGKTLGCNDTTPCTGAVPGAPYIDQSAQALNLSAGQTYYIAAGHHSGDAGGVVPGLSQIAIRVEQTVPPAAPPRQSDPTMLKYAPWWL